MGYHPKYPQPFSFSNALKFDPDTITEGSALTSFLEMLLKLILA